MRHPIRSPSGLSNSQQRIARPSVVQTPMQPGNNDFSYEHVKAGSPLRRFLDLVAIYSVDCPPLPRLLLV